ncbi:ATP-binding protein [Actinacidiphila bryophytorum]|jgi:anti-sigma regulatory factor (Ser/Thr protein kinase)|uniref:ATP-binding protein n=1 Tax=Actinacidiphila bryophytorum TaxID=1436133 RepID=UPI002176CFBF|nr:ATP-binding protein [Actinacidiphila bryophytorum]UWE11553.1 ATP-binding protein [Actinacidiphila bryophytorum]
MEQSTTDRQVTVETGQELVVTRWPLSARSVGRARGELRGALRAWGLERLAEPAELVLSELLTNAVRYARTPAGRLVETRYQRMPDGIRIEVHDANDRMPQMRRAADDDEGGRGLALVDVLTGRRWGVSSRQGVGKLVWALVS